jgi:hypothetical protein
MTTKYTDSACVWTMEPIDSDGAILLALDPFYLISDQFDMVLRAVPNDAGSGFLGACVIDHSVMAVCSVRATHQPVPMMLLRAIGLPFCPSRPPPLVVQWKQYQRASTWNKRYHTRAGSDRPTRARVQCYGD